eukprot:661622-Prymnesium_polylepis.2
MRPPIARLNHSQLASRCELRLVAEKVCPRRLFVTSELDVLSCEKHAIRIEMAATSGGSTRHTRSLIENSRPHTHSCARLAAGRRCVRCVAQKDTRPK